VDANGSVVAMVVILVGTAVLLLVMRMVGVYAAATHEFILTSIQTASRPAKVDGVGLDAVTLVALLTAAAAIELGLENVEIQEINEVHELTAAVIPHDWSTHGRQMIFQSHRLHH